MYPISNTAEQAKNVVTDVKCMNRVAITTTAAIRAIPAKTIAQNANGGIFKFPIK